VWKALTVLVCCPILFLGILKNPLVFPDQKNTEANKERANKNEIAIFNGNFYI